MLTLSICLAFVTGTMVIHLTENVDAAIIEVGDGMEYECINSALENATDGDTILIHQGTYQENILVEKQLVIRGTDSTGVIIDGSDDDIAVNIVADGVIFNNLSVINAGIGVKVQGDNVHVENCHVNNSDKAIVLYNVLGGHVQDVTISNSEDGILIWHSEDISIFNVTVNAPLQNGIRLSESCDIIIDGCIITDPGYHPVYVSRSNEIFIDDCFFSGGSHGLFLYKSQSITLTHNHMARGIGINGDSLSFFDSHFLENNTVDGGVLYYLRSINGINMTGITGQIVLVNVTESVVYNSIFSDLETGMILAYSNDNILVGNTMGSNFEGVKFIASTENTLHHNNFINNTRQVYSPDNSSKENTWTDGLGDGNHWSDYHGIDDGSNGGYPGDGVGDTEIPHPFDDKGGGYHQLDSEPLINATKTVTTYIHLNSGWNFVSLELVTPSHQLADVLESVDGMYDKLIVYEAQSWFSFVDGRPNLFNNFNKINRSMGFWIHMMEPGNLTVTGTTPARTKIVLNPGWNMVGMPSATAFYGENLPENVTIVGLFNDSMEYMLEYHNAGDVIYLPNNGYWLKLEGDVSVVWNVVWCSS